MGRKAWPGWLAAGLLLPSVALGTDSPRATGETSRAERGLAEAVAGGASIEPTDAPLRGDRGLGLPRERTIPRPERVLPQLLQAPAAATPNAASPASGARTGEGAGVTDKLRRYLGPPPGANINDDKRLNPTPPSYEVRQHEMRPPTEQTDP